MKKYTKETNEFLELVKDSSKAVIEEGVGVAFNTKQVDAIRKKLNRFFAKNSIIVSEDKGIYTISLCDSIIPIVNEIIEKAKLLKQFCLNNEKNREKLCSAKKATQLDRIYHDIIINW